MNRRRFLGSLFAGSAMLAAPKMALATAQPIPPISTPAPPRPTIDTRRINARAKAKTALAEWLSNEMDRIMFEQLIG